MRKEFEKIIERLEDNSMMFATSKKFWDNPQNDEYVRCAVDIETAVKIVNQVASEHGGGWIPVKERLPEPRYFCDDKKPKYYLVQCANGRMEVAEYLTVHQDSWMSHSIKVKEVIAWQPLPEAYQRKDE